MVRSTWGWTLEEAGAPLVWREHALAAPGASDAIVEVLACGACHTDLSYADGSVRPNHALPLVLGHEVVGRVVEAGSASPVAVGATVLVPAVLPCGACAFCTAGRGNACPQQAMPGNDIHGGFAHHLRVPAAPLVPVVGAPAGFDICALAVVADAVSTAWQAVARAGLRAGDVAFVLGAGGGVGGYVAQIAKARGAHVIAMDLDEARLAPIAALGVFATLTTADVEPRALRKQAHGLAQGLAVPSLRWSIFECSGHPRGQDAALTLLARGAVMVQVGYTPAKIELRLSNLMAFDATVHGTWGCPPESYPAILQAIFAGEIQLGPFVVAAPLAEANRVLDDMAHHRLRRRVVLVPGAG